MSKTKPIVGELVPVDGLAVLAEKINAAHAACEQALKAGLSHALTAGKLLVEAKAKVKHGEWLPWLKANVRFSERTAQGYMRVARLLPELEANPQRVADLALRDAMPFLAGNDDERQLECAGTGRQDDR